MKNPHPSHQMGEWEVEIRSPAGTPRFYSVRRCENCGGEELHAAAGHFTEEVEGVCPAGPREATGRASDREGYAGTGAALTGHGTPSRGHDGATRAARRDGDGLIRDYPIVWGVMRVPNRNCDDATRYGRLVWLTRSSEAVFPDSPPDHVAHLMGEIEELLGDFKPDLDYLLLSGDPVLIGCVVAHVMCRFGSIRMLKWDGQMNCYYEVDLEQSYVIRSGNRPPHP